MAAILGGRPEGLPALHLDDELDARARLVVVGNGMAGARLVEEVLERGGGKQFRITVLGDEPHGNYNRIMLSPVLAGEEHEDDIVLNSHGWYADNGVTLRAGVRAEKIDTAAKLVHADDGSTTPYDHLVLATGSYSFIPPMTGVRTDAGDLLPGVYGFRTIDETRAMLDAVGRCKKAVVHAQGGEAFRASAEDRRHQTSTSPRSTTRSPVTPSGAAACSSTTVPPWRSSTTRSGTWTSPLAPIGNQRIGSPSRTSRT